MKWKKFFIIFKGLPIAKNYLRPESAPLANISFVLSKIDDWSVDSKLDFLPRISRFVTLHRFVYMSSIPFAKAFYYFPLVTQKHGTKMKFSIKVFLRNPERKTSFFVKWKRPCQIDNDRFVRQVIPKLPNLQFPADLVTFTEGNHNGELHFLCSAWLSDNCQWMITNQWDSI